MGIYQHTFRTLPGARAWGHAFLLLLVLFALLPAHPLSAQTKKINALKSQRTQIEKGIKRSQAEISQTKHTVGKKEQRIDLLGDQLQSRLEYIHGLERDIDAKDREVVRLEAEVCRLDSQVTKKKNTYKQSLRYARVSQSLRSPLLFIFSASSFPQLYRRMRYAREFAAMQKRIGVELMGQQNRMRRKQNELLRAKQQLSASVQAIAHERKLLFAQQQTEKANVKQLRKKQQALEKKVAEQQQQLAALNKKIDELVAYEIEQARKRAEAARKAEEKRKREAAQRSKATAGSKNASKGTKGAKGSKGGTSVKASSAPSRWLTAQDQQLNGNFEHNKGRLPVPITGPYRIANHFGRYSVPGLSGVTLDNKGVNYIGQSGARARAVFDGEVSAVFAFGGSKNVLVRHGSYISVYCNLSSTIVGRGQKVKAKDIIGTVAADADGNIVLHFQLRKETAKLNPEVWIGR